MILNKEKEYVIKLINAIYKNEGYCPCKVGKKQENICPCTDFMKKNECKCKLYVDN